MNWFNLMRNILKGLRLFKCTCRLYLDLSNIRYWSISNWLIMMQYDAILNVFRLLINTRLVYLLPRTVKDWTGLQKTEDCSLLQSLDQSWSELVLTSLDRFFGQICKVI